VLHDRVAIGRHYENDVVVADREVSKRHAVVERLQDGGFVLRDLGSSNGTFVNGRRVEALKLRDGDEIRLGTSRIVFRAGHPSQGPAPRVVQAPSVTQVLASVRPLPMAEAAAFLPVDQVPDLETLRKDYERLRVAYRFHQETGLILDPSDLYRRILDLSFELLPAENGVVLEPDQAGYRVAWARSKQPGEEIQVSRTLIEQVAERSEGVLSTDAITDQRFKAAASMVARGIRSVLAVPLVVRDTLRAIIYLDSRQVSSFTAKDLDILSALAAQAAVSLGNAELIEQIKREEMTRSRLERYLSPALVQKAQRGELDLQKGGTLVRATILFSDIRGFTTLAEQTDPETVVSLLNTYFEEMVDVVFEHQGILDKFIGDAVMALWGVPVSAEDDAQRAVRAAVAMQERVARLNAERSAAGLPAIAVGIGVNTGECVVGNMGSSRRLEYTAIGDAVNLASRLCDLAAGGEVLISEATRDAQGPDFTCEALPPKQVKGKARPVPIYRVG
jgi:adenylate cyclase